MIFENTSSMLHETILYLSEVNDSAGTGGPAPALIEGVKFSVSMGKILL